MAGEKILIVEDEHDVLELIRYNLVQNNYKVEIATSGDQALPMAQAAKPDLILLDLMLPSIDGLQVCKQLKRSVDTEKIPVIILTARSEESDIVSGLELGADDYITKPFSPRVLIARIRAVLRRAQNEANTSNPASVLSAHGITIDRERYKVLVNGDNVDMTSTEFSLLNFLIARPGRVFTRYQIVDAIHGNDYPVTDRSIDVQIVGLRKKLGTAGKCIETVRGVGYRFKE